MVSTISSSSRAMAAYAPEVRWPLLAENLADPSAPGFPVYEFLADPRSKYGRSTDYHFHRSHTTSYKEIGVYDHRPLLSTGAVDLPPTDDFIGSELFNRGLAWARSPLPGAWAYNADWGPLYSHQTNPTAELLGGCLFPLKIVNYARDQAAAHYPASQDLAERFKRILSVLPICTGHRYLGPMKGNREWYEKTHEVHCGCCRKHGWTSKNTIWRGGHETSQQHIDAYVQVRSETRTSCVHGDGLISRTRWLMAEL